MKVELMFLINSIVYVRLYIKNYNKTYTWNL